MNLELCDLALRDAGLTAAQRKTVTGLHGRYSVAARADVGETPDQHVFANPYYWAAFILVGDWR